MDSPGHFAKVADEKVVFMLRQAQHEHYLLRADDGTN